MGMSTILDKLKVWPDDGAKCNTFHGNPSNNCQYISVWTKVVESPPRGLDLTCFFHINVQKQSYPLLKNGKNMHNSQSVIIVHICLHKKRGEFKFLFHLRNIKLITQQNNRNVSSSPAVKQWWSQWFEALIMLSVRDCVAFQRGKSQLSK